jgi:phosphatidate cytidylyltransferase
VSTGRRPPAGSSRRERSPARERPRRKRSSSDLSARIVAALPAIAFAIFIVVEGGAIFALGVMLLGLACLQELYTMLHGARPVKLAGFVALIGLVFAAHFGTAFHVLLITAIALPLLFVLTVARPLEAPATPAMATTLMGIYWIGLAVAHIVLLRDLPHGGGIVVDILVGTFIGDTAAYLGGRTFGHRPLAPSISPNKTVEGLAFGAVGAVLALFLASTYQEWLTPGQAMILGLTCAVFAPLGDLFESLVKRSAGTKDTGRLFGPHGGALDRLDAVLFTLVAGYYVWVAMLPG